MHLAALHCFSLFPPPVLFPCFPCFPWSSYLLPSSTISVFECPLVACFGVVADDVAQQLVLLRVFLSCDLVSGAIDDGGGVGGVVGVVVVSFVVADVVVVGCNGSGLSKRGVGRA